jgi:uncharacterized protein (TIGR03083 family)
MTATERALPAGLRARVLDASRQARAVGRVVPEVPEITPVDAFSRAAEALYQTLGALTEDDWRRPALRELDVQGLVGHLTGVESDLQRAMSGDPEVGAAEHVKSTQAAADRQAGRLPVQTLGEWHEAVQRTLTLAATVGLQDVIVLHGVPLPLHAWLVARAFELWTHENDIRRACGLSASVPDASTLTLMTRLAASLLPVVLAQAAPGHRTNLHLVLTGSGGGTWDVEAGDAGLPDPGQLCIVTDTVGFCRLVANRAEPAELELYITGDRGAADGILAAATALALD